MKPAYRHYCPNRMSALCTRGAGRPRRQRCRHCGSGLLTEAGRWGTFKWNVSASYPLAAAVGTFASEQAAERAAGSELVVRFVIEETAQ